MSAPMSSRDTPLRARARLARLRGDLAGHRALVPHPPLGDAGQLLQQARGDTSGALERLREPVLEVGGGDRRAARRRAPVPVITTSSYRCAALISRECRPSRTRARRPVSVVCGPTRRFRATPIPGNTIPGERVRPNARDPCRRTENCARGAPYGSTHGYADARRARYPVVAERHAPPEIAARTTSRHFPCTLGGRRCSVGVATVSATDTGSEARQPQLARGRVGISADVVVPVGEHGRRVRKTSSRRTPCRSSVPPP